jgi:hypothetical protein
MYADVGAVAEFLLPFGFFTTRVDHFTPVFTHPKTGPGSAPVVRYFIGVLSG